MIGVMNFISNNRRDSMNIRLTKCFHSITIIVMCLFMGVLAMPSLVQALEVKTSVRNAYDVAGKVIISFEIAYDPSIVEIDYMKSSISKYKVPDLTSHSVFKSEYENKLFGETQLRIPDIDVSNNIIYNKNKKHNTIIERISYELQIFEIEDVYILPMSIFYRKSNRTYEYKTPTITIFVKDLAYREDNSKINLKGLKSPFTMKNENTIFIVVISISILLLLGISATILIVLYRKRKSAGKNDKTPVRATIDKLYDLQSSLLLKDGKVKQFYIYLSEIIRHFLAVQLDLDIMENPTEKIKQMLSGKIFNETHYSKIVYLLEQCDLVKYATYIPDKANIENDLLKAFDVVYSFEIQQK